LAIPRVPSFNSEALPSSKLSALGDATKFAINPTACGVVLNAAANITTGSASLITFDVKDFDTGTQITVPSTTITVAEAGFYQLSAYMGWSSNATGYRLIQIEVNGTSVTSQSAPALSGIGNANSCSIGKLLVAGDAVALRVLQNSGSTLTITGRMSVARVSGS